MVRSTSHPNSIHLSRPSSFQDCRGVYSNCANSCSNFV